MLINRAGTMVIAFMSVYCIRQLHFTIVQSGLVMMLFGLGSIAGVFVGGKLTDKIGFYELQVGALFTGGLLFFFLVTSIPLSRLASAYLFLVFLMTP
jgi:predicted MFS family arabinose efflux permease